jgi:putative ABC transport system permease protein
MSPADTFRFALTALAGHRLRTGLSLLGVAIGVAAVVVLTALGEGARTYVIDQFATLGTNLLVVIPGKTETTGATPGWGGVPHDLTLDDAIALQRALPALDRLAPLSMGNETVASQARSRQIPVIGSTDDMLTVRDLHMAAGQFLPPGPMDRGEPVVVLGRTTARELFPGINPLGEILRIGDWRMRVIGVLGPRGVHLGMDMDDIVIVPVATGMQMFNRTSLYRILLKARTHADTDRLKHDAITLLTQRHREEDVTIITQESVISTFSDILRALTLGLAGIASISLLVAGVGIMNVMLVSVAERTGEIGLLKAVGAKSGQILACFLAEAATLATAGGLLGLAAGWAAVAVLVRIYPALPARSPLWAVAAALGVSVVVGLLFGFLPARRATHLDPVAALARSKA